MTGSSMTNVINSYMPVAGDCNRCNRRLHSRSGDIAHIMSMKQRQALPATARGKRGPAGRKPSSKPYHHGDLRRVLIDAALQLVNEGGAEAVSVREAARRAGVSPGAPFRHFPTRTALMTAVAEESMRRFRAEIDAALLEAPADQPLRRLRAIALAYLRWAMRNPAYFEVHSTQRL